MQSKKLKVLFSGGGTGGHLFPAVAVAAEVSSVVGKENILFIGTKNRIEGRVVPSLGYNFKSVSVIGLSREINLKLFLFPFKMVMSILKSLIINFRFKPDVAVGTGGYVSGPAIFSAHLLGAKVLLLEQNSYPGITTRWLERYAKEVHLTYNESKKYLKNPEKAFLTGNPVRFGKNDLSSGEAKKILGFAEEDKLVFVIGGSLGAKTINKTIVFDTAPKLKDVRFLLQSGEKEFSIYDGKEGGNLKLVAFIEDMYTAYIAADLVISRAGATAISEILVLGKPAILIPSPNVTANHQYHNAKSLFDEGAVEMIEDKDVPFQLTGAIADILFDENKLSRLSKKALELSKPNAAKVIAGRILSLSGRDIQETANAIF